MGICRSGCLALYYMLACWNKYTTTVASVPWTSLRDDDDDDDVVPDLTSVTHELLPLRSELSACVRVSLPSLIILSKDALAVTKVHHQCVHCGLAEFHARLQTFIIASVLATVITTSISTLHNDRCLKSVAFKYHRRHESAKIQWRHGG